MANESDPPTEEELLKLVNHVAAAQHTAGDDGSCFGILEKLINFTMDLQQENNKHVQFLDKL